VFCTACDYTSATKTNKPKDIEAIVDFSKVDASPYFKVCEELLDEAKTICFRTHIKKYFTKKLQKLALTSDKLIDEKISVMLIINKEGKVRLKELELTPVVSDNFPTIEASIQKIITELPVLYPAIKRGIPVTTEYKLPINITVK